jgi:ubiquinone/menaquinone biosynthesis C-methylase UbiE
MAIPKIVHLLPLLLSLTLSACGQQSSDSIYSTKTPSRDGIGKVYMGREIASVMSFDGVDWLERNSRTAEENTSLAIKKLPVNKNSIVADVGAGSGFYTFRIARRVPEGRVYAVEIQDDAIKYLEEKSRSLKLNNVQVVKGSAQSPGLQDSSIDLLIMVDVYHELEYPSEFLQSIKRALRPSGKLLLLEYKAEDPAVRIKAAHKMSVAQVEHELAANGFKLVQQGSFLTLQHFLVFEKNESTNNKVK